MVWNIFIFPYTGKAIIPFDFHIFQRGRLTTNQISYLNHLQTCHLPSCNSLAGAVPVAAIFTSREPFVKCSWAPILRDRKNHSCQVHNLRGQSKFTRDIWMSSGNQTWQCLQSPLLMDRSSIIYKETHNIWWIFNCELIIDACGHKISRARDKTQRCQAMERCQRMLRAIWRPRVALNLWWFMVTLLETWPTHVKKIHHECRCFLGNHWFFTSMLVHPEVMVLFYFASS